MHNFRARSKTDEVRNRRPVVISILFAASLALNLATADAQNGAARLVNLSSRAYVGTGSGIEIAGFVISGQSSEQILIRAIGPTLASFGVSGTLPQPVLSLFDHSGNLIASNTGWSTNSNSAQIASVSASAGAFPLVVGSADSVLLVTLAPGQYTAQVSGMGGAEGNALAEVYLVGAGASRAVNLSTRAYVGTGASVLIAGFSISGTGTEQLLIRGIGPALASYGVAATLAQPQIAVYNSAGVIIASNTGWGTSGYADGVEAISTQIGAFALPSGSADCAVLADLPAGNYTVGVSGINSGTGNGLVELYELPVSTPAPTWNLNTADTQLTLTVVANRPAITRLEDTNPSVSWNWAPSGMVLPLLSNVSVNGTQYTPSWTYQGATENASSGTSVTLTFASTAAIDGIPGNGLGLTQTWWAANGPGPVEETTSITNNTGASLTLVDSDVIAADSTVYADKAVTLWRFGRESVNNAADTGFTTGVFRTPMTANLNDSDGNTAAIASTVSNDYNPRPYCLPFVMLDVGGVHGVYFGYEWDFGVINNETYSDALAVRNQFSLWTDQESVTEAAGAVFTVPAMFFGTYTGDTDTGSNRMKEWFWNNKITPTIKSTPNEPLVELNVNFGTLNPSSGEDDNTEANVKAWFASNPISSWGVQLAKLDAGWTDDVFSDPFFGWDWNPNTKTWPDGMVAGTLAHANGVQLSLYMANRYAHADLATPSGVSSEQQALLTRYDGWQYDYWRSDMEFEPTADYLSHQGFLQVLDFMIVNRPPGYGGRPGFRWENCSAGGSKKSFDLLQRQSMMTTEDSGATSSTAGLNYLMAYYANSYMICPVQMKDDNVDVPNYPPNTATVDTVPWEKYTFRTGFLGAWMYGGGGQVYPQHVSLYAQHQRPILRGADVYHLAGFPFPDGNHWDGFEFFNTALNKGSVILLKPLSSVSGSPAIYLKGLDPAALYTLTFQDRTSLNPTYASVPGSQLMAGGTGIAPISGTANDYDSEIIWINP
jgi:hypothetical protein